MDQLIFKAAPYGWCRYLDLANPKDSFSVYHIAKTILHYHFRAFPSHPKVELLSNNISPVALNLGE